jgi:flagellar basal-body rod modification protein FlgD
MTAVAAPTSAPSATSSTDASILNAQTSLAGDQATFIKLLTAQLRNQDPLSPLDANQFTQQLVVMTGVQQQILTNQLMNQLIKSQSSIDPVNLIGKTVTAATPQSALQGGKADWVYNLNGPAKDVSVQVVDSLGRLVWQSTPGAQAAGDHAVSWNGKTLSGVQLPDGGVYQLQVAAKDTNGSAVTSNVYQKGVATSVDQTGGQVLINVGGVKVPASSILSIGLGA